MNIINIIEGKLNDYFREKNVNENAKLPAPILRLHPKDIATTHLQFQSYYFKGHAFLYAGIEWELFLDHEMPIQLQLEPSSAVA